MIVVSQSPKAKIMQKTISRVSGLMTRSVLVTVLLSFCLSIAISIIPAPSVSAQGERYILYYPDDDASKSAIKKTYDKSGSDEFKDPNNTKVSILAYGGDLFKDGPQRLEYNLDTNYNLSNHGTGDGDDNNEQFFTKFYYCDSKGKITFNDPKDPAGYYRVTYNIGLFIEDGNELFNNETHNDNGVGASKIVKITPEKSNGSGKAPTPRKEEKIKDLNENDGAKHLDDDIDKMDPASCRPNPVGEDKIKISNYYSSATDEDRKAVESLIAGANKGGSSGNSSSNNADDNADCDANFSSPLAWIMCPIIEGIADLSDFIFNDLIEPMLKNIPVSTDPGDPSYRTWQGFRTIANIILVGSMLLLVYGILRGGR